MSNNGNVPTNYLAKQLVDIVLKLEDYKPESILHPDYPDKVEELKDLNIITGIYKNEDGTIIRVTEKDGSIFRNIYQRDPVKLANVRGGLFYYETMQDLKINFENIGKQNQQFTLYMSSQKPATYRKVSNIDMNDFNKMELNGRYFNDETDTEIILKHKEGNNYSLIKNGRERNAEIILTDYLRMMDVYKIEIIRNDKKEVVGLNVDRDRIQNVIFERK
jgi:hypothetical protein